MLNASLLVDRPAGNRTTAGTEAILEAVVFGAQTFLNHADLSDTLSVWLQRLGEAANAGQVRIFKNDPLTPGDSLRSSLYAEWCAPGRSGSPLAALQHISFEDVGCARWIELLARGEVVAGNIDELPEIERPILQRENDLSIAIVPVFAASGWWGFIGFADCAEKRTWRPADIHALSAAAGILGAAVARDEMEQRLASAMAQERLATEIGEVLTVSGKNLEDILAISASRIVHHLHVDVVRIWTIDRQGVQLGASPAVTASGDQFPASLLKVGECAVGSIAQTLKFEVWRQELPEIWPGSRELCAQAALTSGTGYPLRFDGKLVGVVVMLARSPLSDAVLEGLFSITDELALAIERNRAASALHLTEDRFRRLVEATLEGICIHDGERIHDANPALAAMVGLPPNGAIGRNPIEFIHPDSRKIALDHIINGYTNAYEANMVRADGTVFPAELKGRNFEHEGVMLRVTSIRDLTERKLAERTANRLVEEQAARELAERNRAFAEFMGDASRILASSFDTSTTLSQLAHLAVRFLAQCCVVTVSRAGVQEQAAIVHADPDKQQALEASLAKWMDREHCAHPLTARQQLGEAFFIASVDPKDTLACGLGWRSVMSAPITSGGQLIGSILFARTDEDRPFDHEQLSIAEELGRRAATALESARSYRDAQAATLARDEMLAVVAHDLRNPLNTIYMASDMALDMTAQDPAAPGRRTFEMIKRSTEHMSRLIQDLLDATRLQSGQLALDRIPVAVTAIVDQAVELLHPLATHAGIEFKTDISDDMPPISADPVRVVQVLSNLVGNALKFTPRGGTITLIVNAGPAGAAFCVRDTGVGIAPDQLPHIFGRFWQARSTDRRGLGLGLAIAKGIVEAHGGRIWVESVVGTGSSFLFTIPQDEIPEA
jgi:PAS domain S-box-containing protein